MSKKSLTADDLVQLLDLASCEQGEYGGWYLTTRAGVVIEVDAWATYCMGEAGVGFCTEEKP